MLGALAVVSVGLFVVAPLSLSAYDEAHRSSVTCTVISAEAASGGTRSLRGVGSSTPQVDVETEMHDFRRSPCEHGDRGTAGDRAEQ